MGDELREKGNERRRSANSLKTKRRSEKIELTLWTIPSWDDLHLAPGDVRSEKNSQFFGPGRRCWVQENEVASVTFVGGFG